MTVPGRVIVAGLDRSRTRNTDAFRAGLLVRIMTCSPFYGVDGARFISRLDQEFRPSGSVLYPIASLAARQTMFATVAVDEDSRGSLKQVSPTPEGRLTHSRSWEPASWGRMPRSRS